LGTALQANGGSNVGNLTGKKSAAKQLIICNRKTINRPQGQEGQEAAKHGNQPAARARASGNGKAWQCR